MRNVSHDDANARKEEPYCTSQSARATLHKKMEAGHDNRPPKYPEIEFRDLVVTTKLTALIHVPIVGVACIAVATLEMSAAASTIIGPATIIRPVPRSVKTTTGVISAVKSATTVSAPDTKPQTTVAASSKTATTKAAAKTTGTKTAKATATKATTPASYIVFQVGLIHIRRCNRHRLNLFCARRHQ